MDLYQIQYFLTIAQAGSFNKATEKLFVSQPSLSAGIKKLEKELGIALFERTGRGVILTSAGKIFHNKAQKILAVYQSVREEINEIKDKPTLQVGTLHSIRSVYLARLIGKFTQKYPNVNIKIMHGYLPDLHEWLEQGDIDIAITWLADNDKSQNCLPLFHQPLKLAVHKNHPFASNKSICLTDLDGQAYIERTNCEFWHAQPGMFNAAGIEPLFVYASNNEEWVISLIQAGLGVSIMPVWSNLKNIVYVPIFDLSLSRVVGLRWRNQQKIGVVERFRKFTSSYSWSI